MSSSSSWSASSDAGAPPAYSTVRAASSSSSSSRGGGGEPPKKYIKVNGISKLNPAYKEWKERQGQEGTSVKDPEAALAVVSTMDDYFELNEENRREGDDEVPLAEGMQATLDIMQDSEVTAKVGLSSDAMVDGLAEIFRKHEAPIGLMNKLMALTEFDALEFILDDSGSMSQLSDTKTKEGVQQTRWEEVHQRLRDMLEVLAYVPTPPIRMHFLNRRDEIVLRHNGEAPDVFLADAYTKLERAFHELPRGGTPIYKTLKKSFKDGKKQSISRYLMCDGEPNGGSDARSKIWKLVCKRKNPEGNPLALLSCTGDDDQVEWMKELEEVAPFVSEYDDFDDESREVHGDQGYAIPYTRGFHLIGQLVGAMNPHDLDAMDESVPFTKHTLDNLLGVVTSPEEYRHYFDEFLNAQRNRKIRSSMDTVKVKMKWEHYYDEFVSTPLAAQIPVVADFKRDLERAGGN